MPIKTLNNQSSQFLGRAFPTLLKLSKGEMQGNRPVDLDYFRARDFLNKDVESAFYELYGKEPVQFANVGLLGNTLDTIAPNWLEEWGKSSGLVKRCDGETMQVWRDKDGAMQSEPMPCACALAGKVTCKPTMYLSLILPDLINASGYLGIVRLTLHSTRELSHILTVLQAQPSVIGLPVDKCRWFISRREEEMTTIINDKPAKVKKWMVNLSVDMDNTLAGNPLLDAGDMRQLPATISDPETGEIIEDETPERNSETILNDFEAILADGSQLSPEWRQQNFDPDQLEVLLLDQLAEEKTLVKVTDAIVIETGGKLYYALDFGFNANKKVILLKTPMQKSDKVGNRVLFKGVQATLSKTESGNYAATPIS